MLIQTVSLTPGDGRAGGHPGRLMERAGRGGGGGGGGRRGTPHGDRITLRARLDAAGRRVSPAGLQFNAHRRSCLAAAIYSRHNIFVRYYFGRRVGHRVFGAVPDEIPNVLWQFNSRIVWRYLALPIG